MIALPSPPRNKALAIASYVGLGALGAWLLAGEYGRRQITRSLRSDFRDEPERLGMGPVEELRLRATDGVHLHAWLFKAPAASPTVILSHGHGGNKHSLLPIAHILFPRYNVLLLDARGHGESEGTRTTIGYEERLDVHAAVDELLHRDLGPVGIHGTSMGAAIAILAAAEDVRIAAVVADSSFARLRWAVTEMARLRGYPPGVAQVMADAACRMTSLRLRYPMAAFDPLEVVGRIAPRPILFIHGEQDELINVKHARLLYARAREPKELWVIRGLAHCRALESAYEAYRERIAEFFSRTLHRDGPALLDPADGELVARPA